MPSRKDEATGKNAIMELMKAVDETFLSLMTKRQTIFNARGRCIFDF